MSIFIRPYAADKASLLRANTAQKGDRYDYDPGVHHARFSSANMKARETIIYEGSFRFYNEGKCFIFITSDKVGSGRKFTVFSTCDGGYSLTKVDQVDTKDKAYQVIDAAFSQMLTANDTYRIVADSETLTLVVYNQLNHVVEWFEADNSEVFNELLESFKKRYL